MIVLSLISFELQLFILFERYAVNTVVTSWVKLETFNVLLSANVLRVVVKHYVRCFRNDDFLSLRILFLRTSGSVAIRPSSRSVLTSSLCRSHGYQHHRAVKSGIERIDRSQRQLLQLSSPG